MVNSTHKNLIGLGLAALILTGCASSDVVSYKVHGTWTSHLRHTIYIQAAANRDLKTTIIGNPFNIDKSVFDERITQLMRGNDRGINGNFRTKPGSSARAGYHLVMMFNPPANTTPADMCRQPTNVAPVKGEKLSVMLAFCDPEPVTVASGSANSAKSPTDPQFEQLIRNVTYEMVPRPVTASEER